MQKALWACGLMTLGLVSIACTSPQEVSREEPVSGPSGAAERFVGSWVLASWTRESSSGEIHYPHGEDAFGRIIYQANGRMMVVLMRRNRPTVSIDGAAPKIVSEIIVGSFSSYTGRYTVDSQAGRVTHHVEASLSPDWVGTDQVRVFEFIGPDRLALRLLPDADDEDGWQTELIWHRER